MCCGVLSRGGDDGRGGYVIKEESEGICKLMFTFSMPEEACDQRHQNLSQTSSSERPAAERKNSLAA